jgi:hypothetical protein
VLPWRVPCIRDIGGIRALSYTIGPSHCRPFSRLLQMFSKLATLALIGVAAAATYEAEVDEEVRSSSAVKLVGHLFGPIFAQMLVVDFNWFVCVSLPNTCPRSTLACLY